MASPFVVCLLTFIKFLVDNLFKPAVRLAFKVYYRSSDKLRPLPHINNSVLLLPAHKLAEKLRNKEITSVELVQAYIERIKQVQPLVNCVVKTLFDEALEEAKHADRVLSSSSVEEKYSAKNAPLLGVPFTCKECIWVKGMPCTTGVLHRVDFRAPHDADVVRFMRDAGAILTCLTNTSELCMWLESSNYLYGTSNNPYNLSRIVGGSSGGEACIVSSAGSVIGVGSDIGGSIRMPAFFNGVYGHKPSSNFISNKTQHPPAKGIQEDMLTTGPIVRYASDLPLMFKIFAGPRYEEVAANFESNTDLKKLKYYYIADLQGNLLVSKPSRTTREALKKARDFVSKSLSVEVKEIQLAKLKSIFQVWSCIMNNGEAKPLSFSKLLTVNGEPINPLPELLKSALGRQSKHTLPALLLALMERAPLANPKHYIELGEKIKQELKSILGDDGILLAPSFPVVAPYHNEALLTNTLDFIYYGVFNVLGVPVTQIPLGLSHDGLPTGVQLVANHKCDHLTIKLAQHFEANMIGWVQPS